MKNPTASQRRGEIMLSAIWTTWDKWRCCSLRAVTLTFEFNGNDETRLLKSSKRASSRLHVVQKNGNVNQTAIP